jgi:lipopolysaccharide transport system ATP-binding protein
MKPAIRVENLCKQYRLGTAGGTYRTLRESLTEAVGGAWKRLLGPEAGTTAAGAGGFWALRDVGFEVQPSEVVGIIGRNGAGKSTLLKILSRIVEPTRGRAEVRGRMGSLLEVGTGFHPELTGRENIYLNGSILGMRRREIDRKFEEIVAFSELEQFLDTPVKRFSSGMYVRLAFAVAAHLEPEILVVDEILAVGDATYQRRCIDRMATLARSGCTILFVSHNMDLVPRLCQQGILLECGRVIRNGAARDIVEYYLERQLQQSGGSGLSTRHRRGDGRARFLRFWLETPDGREVTVHVSGEDLTVCMEVDSSAGIPDVAVAVTLKTLSGTRLISGWTRESGTRCDLRRGRQVFRCRFRRVAIRPHFHLGLILWLEAGGQALDYIEDAGTIEVMDSEATSHISTDSQQGVVLCDYRWEQSTEPIDHQRELHE